MNMVFLRREVINPFFYIFIHMILSMLRLVGAAKPRNDPINAEGS